MRQHDTLTKELVTRELTRQVLYTALGCAVAALPNTRYRPMAFVVAATDTMSEQRARDLLLAKGKPWANASEHCQFESIQRAREVGQGWGSSVWLSVNTCHVCVIGAEAKFRPYFCESTSLISALMERRSCAPSIALLAPRPLALQWRSHTRYVSFTTLGR
eukprot:SAG11_NODE_1189_length_5576_cov_3.002739_1_plen_161_part_00